MTVNTNRGKIIATPEVLKYILTIAQDAADRYEKEDLIYYYAEVMDFLTEIKCALIISGYTNEI